MSPNGFAGRLALTLEPSRRLAALIILLHGLAAFSPWLLPLHWSLQFVSSVLVLLPGLRAWRRYLGAGRITGLVWRNDDQLQLQFQDARITGSIQRISCLHPQLIAFGITVEDGTSRACLVWPDQLHPDQYRRLYARLKFRHTSRHGNRNRT